MLRFFFDRLLHLPMLRQALILRSNPRKASRPRRFLSLLGAMGFICVSLNGMATLTKAQSEPQPENQLIQEFVLPTAPTKPPVYYPEPTRSSSQSAQSLTPAPTPSEATDPPTDRKQTAETELTQPAARQPAGSRSQYVMEFNRSPVVGNRLRLQGVYPETRIGFTRPRNWEVTDAKVLLRYQHSASLLSDKSRLLVRVNDTSIGSISLDRRNSQVGEALFSIPANLIQDYNEVTMLAEHQTSETCSNPADPTLWTEILPDSKLLLNYRPQPIELDFSSYPRPFLDGLSLDANRLAYLRPKTYSRDWLTAAARFQTAAGRQLDYRPLTTQLVKDTNEMQWNDRLIVIGTPNQQPLLGSLPSLPFPVKNAQLLDGEGNPVPDEVGVLMMTVLQSKGTPVLIATGNSEGAVRQAVQFLVQSRDQQLSAGQALTIDQVSDVPSPEFRNWSGYLPSKDQFQLKDLNLANREPFQDVTVRGSNAPTINIPFRSLPDDRFLRGSTMNLSYSYSPQVNPRTSAIEVKLDGVTIGSKRLDSSKGERQTFRLNLPENLIKPDSTLNVNFVMKSRDIGVCGLETDQQLWGTVYGDTSFKLARDMLVNLPDLKLLKTGFPLTAPQDLSTMAVAMPETPIDLEVETLLALGERLGRLSQADSVKYEVYMGEIPQEVRNEQHIVGIGTRSRFPVAEVFQNQGFSLAQSFTRFWGGSQVHALPDQEGVLKATISPWNPERSLFAVTAQTETGLQEVQTLLKQDSLFSQLRGDTVLVSRNQPNPSAYDANGYDLEFLQESAPQRIQRSSSFSQIILFLQDYWFFLLAGLLLLALLLYSLSQVFLNRVADSGDVS